MNILFLGSFFPDSRYEEILSNSIGVIQNAGDTYQKAILTGLFEHLKSFKTITSPMIGGFPKRYKSFFFNKSYFQLFVNNDSVCTSFVNLSIYKVLSRFKSVKNELCLWAESSQEEKYIIIFSLDLSLLRAASEIKEKYPSIKICLIVTDLFRFMVTPKSYLSKCFIRYSEAKSFKYISKVDSFVLLTKNMKDELHINDCPFVIIEGIYNTENSIFDDIICQKEVNNTILYTGTLAKQYGILHLLQAFEKVPNSNYRLWICGDGDAKSEVLDAVNNDNRIKYYGQLRREEVIRLQKVATVLINPRLSDSEYTLYSFPSKTMEYLASGTPTIMHPLKCLPQEYLEHLFIASDESDMGLATTIIDVCERSKEELDLFGKKASNFILTEKNSKVQVKKILDMIRYEE